MVTPLSALWKGYTVKMDVDSVSVIGLGYVGLPTAAIIANRGIEVIGVDINPEIVQRVNAGGIHIAEPDLDILVQGAVSSGRLRASTDVEPASVFVIAVPTPLLRDRKPDLTFVERATRSIAPVLQSGNLVILESTAPVGTTSKLVTWLREERPDLDMPDTTAGPGDVSIAYCPERILPGRVLLELVDNDRIIGGVTETCTERAEAFYKLFSQGECLHTNPKTAELAKLTENAFRDVNIAFANELSLICETLSINVWDLIKLCNHHPRVNILQPGPGVGGHCIAIDPWFIVDAAPDDTQLVQTARTVNNLKPSRVLEKISAYSARLQEPKIACLGLSYKPNIDDLRESPALQIAQAVSERHAGTVLIAEPHIEALPEQLHDRANLELAEVKDAISRSDIVVPLVKHDQFRALDRALFDEKIVIDACGLLVPY